ncbi:MAG: response regulator transcription factor [Desulfuromonadales bacterium]|nr:response regulator transcription factor [Desulfuromonadales bacterium]
MLNNLLIIDDDHELCGLLRDYLSAEGFSVDACHSGPHGVRQALEKSYALIILDVMLPELNGFDVLRRIRETLHVPVLMLTARGDDIDRIVGLELGADDYLAKPFNPRELLARIRAIQRRAAGGTPLLSPTQLLIVDDIHLDRATRTVRRNQLELSLTSVEFDLLGELLEHAGTVVTREMLTRKVLGRELNPFDRSVDVHVSSLRKKLARHADGRERIQAIRGSGYQYTRSHKTLPDQP